MHITAIEPQRGDPGRVNVFVNGEFRLGLAAEVAGRAGFRTGAAVEESALASAAHYDALWRARKAAYNLLAYRARSRRELRDRLREKNFEDDIVESCLDELAERGWIDDRAFAEGFVRDRIRLKPRGARRLVHELAARGVDRSVAEPAIAATFQAEGRSDLDLAREAARSWARRQRRGRAGDGDAGPPFRTRRRLYGYLARRGFESDAIRAAMAEVLHEAAGDE